jgi:hypothetical protein
MQTLRDWGEQAEKRGYRRIAELCDYLQADELTHVKLATEWVRRLTEDDLEHRAELIRWGGDAIARIESFHADDGYRPPADPSVHFTFVKPGGARRKSTVVGE